MIEWLGWGFAAVFGAGWLLTLGVMTRGVVPIANAFKIHQGIVDREYAKVHSLAERALRLQNHGAPSPQKAQVAAPAGTGPMAQVFAAGTPGTGFIDEQPDATEIME